MQGFQSLMNRFLDAQRNVMTAYLGGTRPPAGAADQTTRPGARQIQRALTESRHGLDTPAPSSPNASALPASTDSRGEARKLLARKSDPPAPISSDELTRRLLEIVSERTGYPPEMLDLHVDIEADLGIDSIKRIEILGELARAGVGGKRDLMSGAMEQLARVKTLGGIVQALQTSAGEFISGDNGEGTRAVERPLIAPSRGGNGTVRSLVAGAGQLPLLGSARVAAPGSDSVEMLRVLDPAQDLYLRDHQLDGKPVLPVAMAIELMAEVAQHGWRELTVAGLRDLRVLRGVVLDSGPKPLRLVAHAIAEPPRNRPGLDVMVEIRDQQASSPPYYRTTIELATALPEPTSRWSPPARNLPAFPVTAADAYRDWLFHGPLFQGLVEIEGISERGMVALCKPSSPRDCLAGAPPGAWLIDPVVFDSGLQLIILWARTYHDTTPLPAGCRGYRRLASLGPGMVRCHLVIDDATDGQTVRGSLFFVNSADGRLLGVLEDLECTGSRSLNRLAGRQSRV